jgi:hypothetical protein
VSVASEQTFADLLEQRGAWDAAVDNTRGLDPWSSGSDWTFSAHPTWGGGPEIVIDAGDAGFAAMGKMELEGVRAFIGLDPIWAFASAVVGPQPKSVFARLEARVRNDPSWDLLLLSGLVEDSDLDSAAISAFAHHYSLFAGPEAVRVIANLTDGVDGWWTRRSEKFRRNIRRAKSAAENTGLQIEVVDDLAPELLLQRLLLIEQKSWKGQEDSGLLGGDMAAFYGRMLGPLHGTQRVRAAIARIEGTDVGYILGAVRGSTYRGLQVSYGAPWRHLSIGNLLQDHEVRRVGHAGITRYDLGMEMPYKHHWADTEETTRTIVVRR